MKQPGLALWLKGFGAPACFASALVALPIPIVHFVFVPAHAVSFPLLTT